MLAVLVIRAWILIVTAFVVRVLRSLIMPAVGTSVLSATIVGARRMGTLAIDWAERNEQGQ